MNSGETYHLEIWGYKEEDANGKRSRQYCKKKAEKIELYKKYNINLISIENDVFSNSFDSIQNRLSFILFPILNRKFEIVDHSFLINPNKISDDELFHEIMKFSNDSLTLPKENDFNDDNKYLFLEAIKRFGNYGNFAKRYNVCTNNKLGYWSNASATARQLQDLVDVQKTLTHSEIVDNANDSYAGMMEQIKDYNNQISDLENKQEDYANYNPTTSLSSVSKSIENGYLTLRGLSNEEVDKVKKAIADNFKEFDDENDINATSTWEDGDYIVTINLADQVSKTERKSKSSQVSDAISAYLKDNTANVKIESNEVNAQKKALEAQKQQLISEFASNTVTPYLQTTSVLSNFDSELMAALTNNAKNFDYSSIESEYGGDVDEMLRQKIVVPLQQLKPDAQDALRDALNLSFKSTTYFLAFSKCFLLTSSFVIFFMHVFPPISISQK